MSKSVLRSVFWFALIWMLAVGVYAQDEPDIPTTVEELEPWTCPPGFEGQELNIYNWATYIHPEAVPQFEELCGVTITYDVYDSNESLIARMQQGNPGYDLAIPSDYAVAIMIREGLVQPLNKENIPNAVHLIPGLLDKPFDPGNQYSYPYLWSTTGIGYNITEVGEEITSWEQVFHYEGPVAWLGDPRSMLSFALKILGYDPNSVNPDELEEARAYLMERKDNVYALAQDDGDALLGAGEVDIAIEYSGDIYQLIADCECDDYRYVIPEEAGQQDISSMVVLTDAPNPALAEVFIDYILHPQVSADLMNYTAYSTPNQTSINLELVDEELLNNPAITPDAETLERLYQFEDIGDDEVIYLEMWDEMVIEIGQ